jgi:hypothetical protein
MWHLAEIESDALSSSTDYDSDSTFSQHTSVTTAASAAGRSVFGYRTDFNTSAAAAADLRGDGAVTALAAATAAWDKSVSGSSDGSSGGGYSKTAKRVAAKAVVAIAVVSVILAIVQTLSASVPLSGTPTTDSGAAAIQLQCGRTMKQYLLEIDRACCGDPTATFQGSHEGEPWCSGARRQEHAGHALYACSPACHDLVLPLWEQCIQPELLQQSGVDLNEDPDSDLDDVGQDYGGPASILDSPFWLFAPVVAKCSQEPMARATCVDDNAVVDDFSQNFIMYHTDDQAPYRFVPDYSSTRGSNVVPLGPQPSLCEEIRDGLVKCDDILGPGGVLSDEYPRGWYDDTCCESCPVYWPRRLFRMVQAPQQGADADAAATLFDPDMLSAEHQFKTIVAALEQQDVPPGAQAPPSGRSLPRGVPRHNTSQPSV